MIALLPTIYSKGSSARLALRDWGLFNWLELHSKLTDNNYTSDIIVEKHLKSYFTDLSTEVISPTGLVDLVETMKSYKLVVCQDSGPMHIAHFLKIQSLVLFGPTSPKVFAPDTSQIVSVNRHCSPCHDGVSFKVRCESNLCMKQITPSMVLNKIKELQYEKV